jgi:Flp pilus assembly pilin Flp
MLALYVATKILAGDFVDRFRREEGASAIEYGVVIAVIVLGLAAVLAILLGVLQGWFGRIGTQVDGLAPAAS